MTTHTLLSTRPNALPACPAAQALADLREEAANTWTHAVGVAGSLIGVAALTALSWRTGQATHLAGSAVYGLTLVLLYCASTAYHAVQKSSAKQWLRIADHVGIYLLIAGTFTPFALASAPRHGLAPLAAGWVATAAAIGLKLARARKESLAVSTIGYVAIVGFIGWLGLDTMQSSPELAGWLWAGTLFYGQGLWFFLQPRRRFFHSIWHLFVIAGSACHYGAVLLLVLRSIP